MNFFKNRHFIRNLYAATLVENFLISAVTTVLSIRFYLQVTGFPQVGGEHFHIAHMLYGGLLMMLTIFMLFTFLNRTALNIASITGGIGFGFFIDELGKFITRDNDYFFQPTIALIYVIFIMIYLLGELLPKYKSVSKKEYLVNAIELTKEVVIADLDMNEKQQALAYLNASDQRNPMVHALRRILEASQIERPGSDVYNRFKQRMFHLVESIARNRMFFLFVIGFIIIQSVVSLLITFFIIAALNKYMFLLFGVIIAFISYYLLRQANKIAGIIVAGGIIGILYAMFFITSGNLMINLSFIGFGTLFSTALAALVAFIGLLEISSSRLKALRYFRISILISIFLTQFFLFYMLQFLALVGLVINILMLLAIEFVIVKKETDEGLGEAKR